MNKTKEQIKKEIKGYELLLKQIKNKSKLNKKDIGQLQLFIRHSIDIYHQIFKNIEYGTYQGLNDQFDKLSKDIKIFYNSIIKIYNLPDIQNLYGLEVEKNFKTDIITNEGIISKNETVFIHKKHKNDYTR
jgi:hypothetical protein